MTENERIAAMLAGATAMLSEICELLIEKGAMDRLELRDRLYRLYRQVPALGAERPAAAPIAHLISIIESFDDRRHNERGLG